MPPQECGDRLRCKAGARQKKGALEAEVLDEAKLRARRLEETIRTHADAPTTPDFSLDEFLEGAR